MILVDIYIPSLGETHDFNLDENVKIISIVQEVSEMLAVKYKTSINKKPEEFMLCSVEDERMLNSNTTLAENGVTNGSKLLML